MIAVTLIAVYLVSAYGTYKFVQIARSPNGSWVSDAELIDVVFTLTPFLNTIACIICWVSKSPYYNRKRNFNRFFNIKTTNNETHN